MKPFLPACCLGLVCAACSAPAEPEAPRTRTVLQPVVGGYVDDEDRGVVGLAIDFNGFWFSGHCSGTLIAPNLVLTARHCVSMTQGEGTQGEVICGQTGFGLTGGGSLFLATPETVRPGDSADPSFYRGTGQVRPAPGASDICGYDIALIVLEGAGMPASVATPVVPRIDSSPEPGDEFSAVGYGLTNPSDQGSSGTRMRRDGNVISCVGTGCSSFLGQVEASEWSGDAPVCPGDSGGPALDAQGRVMGVVSRGGQGCVSSIYGNVGSWGDFIIETALEAAQQGGYDPPFWATSGSSTPAEPEPEPGADAGVEPEAGSDPDALGEPCTGACPAGYVCYSTNGTDGTCVPPCSETAPDCPADYGCAADIGACVPGGGPAGNPVSGDESSGCAVAPVPADPAKPVPWVVGALAAALFSRRTARHRRRRR